MVKVRLSENKYSRQILMKKTVLNFFLLASIAPFLVQCASQTDVDELRYQLRIVNKKLEDMRANTVSQLQKRQAAASGQVDQVQQDIMRLRSQLEETNHLNQQLKEQNKELEETIVNVAQSEASKREEALKQFEEAQREKEQRLTAELNEKLRQQQESVKAIQKARLIEAERRAKETALAAQLAKTRAKSESSGSPSRIRVDQKKIKLNVDSQTQNQPSRQESSVQPATETEQVVTESKPIVAEQAVKQAVEQPSGNFEKAKKLFAGNNFKEAMPLFEQVAGDSTAANNVAARFMLGECLFELKEYDKAIMQYQKIISQHSSSAESPGAMLKQGMAFEKLADKDTAKVIYRKLLKQHGSSPEATTAQERLGKL